MRRALVAQCHGPLKAFALCFPLHQHRDPAFEHGNLGVLTGDNIRKLIDCSDEMGEAFFYLRVCHGPHMAWRTGLGKGSPVAPVLCAR